MVTVVVAGTLVGVNVRLDLLPVLTVTVIVGTAAWFFFYAIFALQIRRNDAFNTVSSIFYFVFLFASSMFYPLEPLPAGFRQVAYANPITWQVDLLRYATVGAGDAGTLVLEAIAFTVFGIATFAAAVWSLYRQE